MSRMQIKFLNRGAYGFVVLAVDTETNEAVALKFIDVSGEAQAVWRGAVGSDVSYEQRGVMITKYVEREILNQLRLRHPHIIALRELLGAGGASAAGAGLKGLHPEVVPSGEAVGRVFLTDHHLVLCMEYAPGGDLFKVVSHLRGLSEDNARWFFQQIILAIDYCHRMGVANRDIKLENTLLDGSARPLVKLADFGFSKDENYQSAPGSRVGTPAYLAPEVIANVHGQSYDAKKADVWSCGVLLYIMVTGRYPFRQPEDERQRPAQRLHAMLQRILSVTYSFPPDLTLSAACRDVISKMLVADPKQRPSIQEVLHHPWCSAGMEPAMFSFNDSIVDTSLANQPPQEVGGGSQAGLLVGPVLWRKLMQEIQNLVREAQHVPLHVLEVQQAQQAQQGQQQQPQPQVVEEVPEIDPNDLVF
ncbi:hypothetical protein N2152v2_004079 [Parachlorella kessleri]